MSGQPVVRLGDVVVKQLQVARQMTRGGTVDRYWLAGDIIDVRNHRGKEMAGNWKEDELLRLRTPEIGRLDVAKQDHFSGVEIDIALPIGAGDARQASIEHKAVCVAWLGRNAAGAARNVIERAIETTDADLTILREFETEQARQRVGARKFETAVLGHVDIAPQMKTGAFVQFAGQGSCRAGNAMHHASQSLPRLPLPNVLQPCR